MSKTEIKRSEAEAILRQVPRERRPGVVCALVGHSKVVGVCFGQVICARCETVIGDTLVAWRSHPRGSHG